MVGIRDIANIWNNVRELDLRPIREAALRMVKISLVGAPGSGRHTLAGQMRSDPSRPGMQTRTPVVISDLELSPYVVESDLIVLMIDATKKDLRRELGVARSLIESGKKLVVFVNKLDLLGEGESVQGWEDWRADRVVFGSALNTDFLTKYFVPMVLDILPDQCLALGRQFPLFRIPIAHQLISETSFSNAAYSLSTGLAEIVPALDLPLNVTDMIILTKAQAFLVYKLGLVFGFSTRWQDYITEFSGVIGTGFLWRQAARELVGLIPVVGIVPKVGVSYAGTYVVGNAILQWYLTGRQVTREQMKAAYAQAYIKGKETARMLAQRMPRPKFGLPRRKPKELPAAGQTEILLAPDLPGTTGEGSASSEGSNTPESAMSDHAQQTGQEMQELQPLQLEGARACQYCGKRNSPDASYCQYCGRKLE